MREPRGVIGYRSNLGTTYFLGVSVLWLIVLLSTISPLHHGWVTIMLIALFVAILDISPANVHVASITLTTSVVLASATNFGLFPTEISLLLSLPLVLIYFRRGNPYAVLFNTSLYGLCAALGFGIYRILGGEIGHYGHHFPALAGYVTASMLLSFPATSLALYVNYRGAVQLSELLQKHWFHIVASYVVEMVLGVLAGVLYQSYGVLGIVAVFSILWLILQTYKKYFEMVYEAEVDDLTRLLNRKAFQAKLSRYMKKGHPISLIMIDVDHFKQVNDSLGHGGGDKVLQETAQILRDVVGQFGTIGRYGGEEFCLLLPLENAVTVAEKLRHAVEHHTFMTAADLRLTISLGMARYPEHASQWPKLFECADRALYEAKRQRNVVKLYAPTEPSRDTEDLTQFPVRADV